MSAVVVGVAHADDETLWIGGGLLRLRDAGVQLTCVCMTNRHEPVRSKEFEAACAVLGATPVMLDNQDPAGRHLPRYPYGLSRALRRLGRPARFDLLLTHSPHGQERTHPHHVQTSDAFRRWALPRRLPVAFFCDSELAELPAQGTERVVSEHVTMAPARLDRRVMAARIRAGWRTAPRPRTAVFLTLVSLRHAWRLRRVRRVARFAVDHEQKRLLYEAHPSQHDGMAQYAAYGHDHELLYLTARAARRLEALCRS